jgi:signal transduction histidine kinase
MSLPTSLTASRRLTSGAPIFKSVRDAIGRVTWRVVGATLAIAVALDAWSLMDLNFAGPSRPMLTAEDYLSAAIINLLVAFSMMFTTFVADEVAANGAKRLPTYVWAVVIGSAIGALLQGLVHQWLDLHGRFFGSNPVSNEAVVMPLYVFFEYLIWGSIIVFIYVNRRNALRARARMNNAHVQRAETQRRAIESRLQVLQARVEPKFLFNTLAQVRDLYESDPAKASRMLGNLIVYLRAALPHLRESTSTLGQEVDLVGAYIAIVRASFGDALAFHIEVGDRARAVRIPPMVLLPVVNHVLTHRLARRATCGAIGIAARNADGKLRLEIADTGEGFASAADSSDLHEVRERLHTLYGGAETLAFERSGSGGSQVVIEIPA